MAVRGRSLAVDVCMKWPQIGFALSNHSFRSRSAYALMSIDDEEALRTDTRLLVGHGSL